MILKEVNTITNYSETKEKYMKLDWYTWIFVQLITYNIC